MPTYDYECGLCDHAFERKQRFDEEPIAECPECGGKSRRVINSVPIIFKGSGFYITDNRKSGDGGKAGGVTKPKEKKPSKDKKKEPVGGESTTTAGQ